MSLITFCHGNSFSEGTAPPWWAPDPPMVGIRSPIGLVVGSCTSHPGVLGSIPKRENSQQLKHRTPTTPTPTTSPVVKAKRQMTSTSSSTSSNPRSPNPTLPTRSDGRQLRSRTSSLSNDPTTTNDPVQTSTWSKYTWQNLTKAPKGSQMFHSPPLIRALQLSKSETTPHISPRHMAQITHRTHVLGRLR